MKTTLERGHHKFVGGDPALEGAIIIKDADRLKICLRNSRLNQSRPNMNLKNGVYQDYGAYK